MVIGKPTFSIAMKFGKVILNSAVPSASKKNNNVTILSPLCSWDNIVTILVGSNVTNITNFTKGALVSI